jgi:Ca2+-binding RTX toxin-like protein
MVTQGFTNQSDGSHAGIFNAIGNNDITFAGIERFSYTDLANGADLIVTGRGNDTVRAGGGNDTIVSGSGIDIVDGGAGTDVWSVDLGAANRAIVIDLNGVSTFLGAGSVQSVEGFGRLVTGTGKDVITGHRTSVLSDSIATGGGQDRITLWHGGNDSVNGGSGIDTLVVVNEVAGGLVTQGFTNHSDGSHAGIFNAIGNNDITFAGIERFSYTDLANGADLIVTGRGNDTIAAGGGNDTVSAGEGNDRINGGGANDVLNGGDGNDTLQGGGGADTLDGGAGEDRLNGGTGNDRLTGGAARDVFVFDRAAGRDTVADFTNGEDKIDLRAFDLAGLAALQAAGAVGAVAGGVRIDLGLIGGSGSVTLAGFALADLNGADFFF